MGWLDTKWNNLRKTGADFRPRDIHDFYPTPLSFALASLNLLGNIDPKHIIDPGAGSGVWGEAARKKFPTAIITGVELRPVIKPAAYNFWYQSDYRNLVTLSPVCDLIIGNPPYKYAEEFVRLSLPMLEPGGKMVFLLRLAFLESQRRLKLWHDYKPQSVTVCANRPSFTGDGNTDATAYAIFIWEKGWTGSTALDWLYVDTTNEKQLSLFAGVV